MNTKAILKRAINTRAFLRNNNALLCAGGQRRGQHSGCERQLRQLLHSYLVENYAQIGIVDLRYTVEKVDSFIQRGGYDKVLVL